MNSKFQDRKQHNATVWWVLNFVPLAPTLVRFTMDLPTGHLQDRYRA